MMPRTVPKGCPRGRDDCIPLHSIDSDPPSKTFICCGLPDDFQHDDCFRNCFKSETTDTMYDYNELDMLDCVEVMTRAMTTQRRLADV